MRPVWIAVILAGGLLLGQQAAKDKPKPVPKPKEQPKQEQGGLFKNKLGYQSSKQSKDSMTLGFNGIDPSGRVDKEMLAKQPSSADAAAVAKLSESRPSEAALRAFVREGGLK